MGDVRRLWIEGPTGRLEAALRSAAAPCATAVIAHPHPLYGGTLHNPVVFHADRELNRAGLITLRFNFRGVGESDGFHDEGRGEIADVAACAAWIRGLTPELPLVLVGYSFGSRCSILHALEDRRVAAVVAVGLPLRVLDLSAVAALDRPLGVVQGSRDAFGSPDEVRALAPRADVRVLDGAEHLFPGRAPDAGRAVAEVTRDLLSRLA
ncbi:MAG TPA: alpha/beta fold hydrolase [Candidatus Polarisedimenticolaceae bacterium]